MQNSNNSQRQEKRMIPKTFHGLALPIIQGSLILPDKIFDNGTTLNVLDAISEDKLDLYKPEGEIPERMDDAIYCLTRLHTELKNPVRNDARINDILEELKKYV